MASTTSVILRRPRSGRLEGRACSPGLRRDRVMADGVELEVSGLTRRYSAEVTVGPISFEVRAGEFFSLLGPSGCGKTTTLRCIAGFESLGCGRDPAQRRAARRQAAASPRCRAGVPELRAVPASDGVRQRRVRPQIAARRRKPRSPRGSPRSCASSTCRRWRERLPAQLSGGQQQRVAIARSLVLEPRILMFDEPLSNLDFKLRIQMRDELRGLQRRLGKTAIYVTHDQTEALALSDRIAVLSHGQIEQIGTPGEIYERAGDRLRRRIHRQLEPVAGADRRAGRQRRGGRDRGRAAPALRRVRGERRTRRRRRCRCCCGRSGSGCARRARATAPGTTAFRRGSPR